MFLRTGDLTVHLRVEGPAGAPALLLLHSLGTSLGIWDAQAEALQRSFRVIRPDLRGHGLTSVTPGPYDMDQLGRDALAVLDGLGIDAAHVAGVSIGGLIAQSLALQAPNRVRSLILVDTALAIPPREFWVERATRVRTEGLLPLMEGIVARWVTPPSLQAPDTDGLRAMLLRTPPEGYAGAAEAIANADFTDKSRAIAAPTLVVVGDGDQATPVASAQALQRAIPGARLEILPDAAHIPTVERPEAVLAAMQSILSPAVADLYEAGMGVRRQVLGDAHVDRATAGITALDRDFQGFITRTAWGGVWARPHLDRRTRSLLTLALMAALGHHEEFALHVRASRNTGATDADLAELLIQVAVYAGVPAANSAVRIAKQTLAEMESAGG
jgi:3-oxoadipate enol-lactonase / 4-carboxymuconolactone decarboxylase